MDNGVLGLTSWLGVLSAMSIEGGSREVTLSQLASHFHLLRVAGGSGGKERADEAIFIQGARLCLWTAHPDPAQRHRAHASGIERSPWHFTTSGGGVGSRKQLSQG